MLPYMCFDAKIAKIYGVNNAVVVNIIADWIDYCRIRYRENDCDFSVKKEAKYENSRYWDSILLSGLFSTLHYLSKEEFISVLKDCVKKDLIRLSQRLDENDSAWDGNKVWISIGDASPYSYLNNYLDNTPKIKKDRFGGNKKFVHNRDGEKCCICGSVEKLSVHHIDGYFEDKPENNKANKLILVCIKCHSKIHGKKNPLKIPRKELERIGYFEKE